MNPNVIFKKHRHRVGIVYFVSGILVGLLLSYVFLIIATSSSSPSSPLLRSSLSPLGEDGWHPIHVFYGKTDHISYHSAISKDYFGSVVWYSQARQDEVVAALLRNQKNGYFVDLAANDPIKISNTYALETQFNWKGLCIEPNPIYWPGLSYRTNCHIVGAVIGSDRLTPIQFRFPKDMGPRGGIVGNGFDNQPDEKSKLDDEKPRYTVSLLEIFKKFGTPPVIDYMSLDVEGAEDLVMKAFPFDKYMIRILTLERPSDTLKSLLTSHGYQFLRLLKANSGDTLWVHKSVTDSLDVAASCKINTMKKYLERPTARVPPPEEDNKDNYCDTEP